MAKLAIEFLTFAAEAAEEFTITLLNHFESLVAIAQVDDVLDVLGRLQVTAGPHHELRFAVRHVAARRRAVRLVALEAPLVR